MNPILLTIGEALDKTFYSFDLWFFELIGSMQNSFMTGVARFFTTFGDENFVISMAVLGIALCFFKKTRKYGFTLIFAILVGTIITNVIAKPLVLRIRPYNTLQGVESYWDYYIGAGALSEGDYSFPSGHTTAAFEMATALFICFMKDKKKLAFVFPVVAFCTMWSRVYLMVHYTTDVIGGMIIGIASGIVGYILMKLTMIMFNKTKLCDADAARWFKKLTEKTNNKAAPVILTIVAIVIFLNGYIPALNEWREDTVRCAYNEEYDCYNAAKLDENYPKINGNHYCKIHWKQINGE